MIFLTFIGYKIYSNIGYANHNIHHMPNEFQVLGLYSGKTEKSVYILIFEYETNEPKLFHIKGKDSESIEKLKKKYKVTSANGIVSGNIRNRANPNLDFELQDLSKIEKK